jgi:hypothetical protein
MPSSNCSPLSSNVAIVTITFRSSSTLVGGKGNWGGLGRWAFLEITDPWDAEHLIREKYLEPSEISA